MAGESRALELPARATSTKRGRNHGTGTQPSDENMALGLRYFSGRSTFAASVCCVFGLTVVVGAPSTKREADDMGCPALEADGHTDS